MLNIQNWLHSLASRQAQLVAIFHTGHTCLYNTKYSFVRISRSFHRVCKFHLVGLLGVDGARSKFVLYMLRLCQVLCYVMYWRIQITIGIAAFLTVYIPYTLRHPSGHCFDRRARSRNMGDRRVLSLLGVLVQDALHCAIIMSSGIASHAFRSPASVAFAERRLLVEAEVQAGYAW